MNEYIFFLNDDETDEEFYSRLTKILYQYYYKINLTGNERISVLNGDFTDLRKNNLVLVN